MPPQAAAPTDTAAAPPPQWYVNDTTGQTWQLTPGQATGMTSAQAHAAGMSGDGNDPNMHIGGWSQAQIDQLSAPAVPGQVKLTPNMNPSQAAPGSYAMPDGYNIPQGTNYVKINGTAYKVGSGVLLPAQGADAAFYQNAPDISTFSNTPGQTIQTPVGVQSYLNSLPGGNQGTPQPSNLPAQTSAMQQQLAGTPPSGGPNIPSITPIQMGPDGIPLLPSQQPAGVFAGGALPAQAAAMQGQSQTPPSTYTPPAPYQAPQQTPITPYTVQPSTYTPSAYTPPPMPTISPYQMPNLPSQANSADQYLQAYLQNLQPSQAETTLQQQLATLQASQGMSHQDLEGQPIAASFVTGQEAAVDKGLNLQSQNLTNQLALAQAKQQSAMDVSKAALDYAQGKDTAANQMSMAQYQAQLQAAQQAQQEQFTAQEQQLQNVFTSQQSTEAQKAAAAAQLQQLQAQAAQLAQQEQFTQQQQQGQNSFDAYQQQNQNAFTAQQQQLQNAYNSGQLTQQEYFTAQQNLAAQQADLQKQQLAQQFSAGQNTQSQQANSSLQGQQDQAAMARLQAQLANQGQSSPYAALGAGGAVYNTQTGAISANNPTSATLNPYVPIAPGDATLNKSTGTIGQTTVPTVSQQNGGTSAAATGNASTNTPPSAGVNAGRTPIMLGNGQTVYADSQGNFFDSSGKPVSNSTVSGATAGSATNISTTPKATSSGTTATSSAKGTTGSATFVENSLNSQGLKYQDALNSVPAGQIGVIDNKTGQFGYINPKDYSATKYTKI